MYTSFLSMNYSGLITHVDCLERTGKYTLARHTHSFWQAICVTAGSLTVTTNCGEHTLHAGSFHILPAGCAHALKSDGYRQIGIDFAAGTSELAAIYVAFPAPTCHFSHKLSTYACQLEEMDCNVPLAQEMIRTLSILMLQTAASAVLGVQEDPIKAHILEYIATQPDATFSLSDMAKALHISASHLERLSHKFFRCGVIALRNQKRCERALLLLTETNLPIREIGELLGFSEPSNFSAFFKRFMGLSPIAYRRAYSNPESRHL